jgi:hypothetical protein
MVAFAETPLIFGDPHELSIQDSIPRRAGERVVLFNRWLQAHWVIVLVNLPYERTRIGLRQRVEQAFGIDTESEIKARVDPDRPVQSRAAEPLFGDGGIELRAVGVPISESREWRIKSKHYNESWWNNYSSSRWRIIDCDRLFNRTCSLVVISRTDHSREWVVMPPGIPLPLKLRNETTLVTDRETRALERFLIEAGQPNAQYFVQPNPGFSADAFNELLIAVRDAAKNLP